MTDKPKATLILTDHGPAVRGGRKGSGGDVR